jgi:hypothetical protein
MHHKTHFEIRQVMSDYTSKGKKSPYKKKQMKRLISILEHITNKRGDHRLEAIGKRQIISYWKETEQETDKTRREKYSILKKFFSKYNPRVSVPEPWVINDIQR